MSLPPQPYSVQIESCVCLCHESNDSGKIEKSFEDPKSCCSYVHVQYLRAWVKVCQEHHGPDKPKEKPFPWILVGMIPFFPVVVILCILGILLGIFAASVAFVYQTLLSRFKK